MDINTTLSNTISVTDRKARYDAACKKILAEKVILAWIMKNTMKEFRNVSIKDIETQYIIGIPEIAEVPVYPDVQSADTISGTGVEDTSINEGTVTFDIRFQALIPESSEVVALIINIEAQNDYYPGYPLIKRALYYCARMISSQYGTIFKNFHYEKIKKVYSVWICLDPPENRKNTITSYQFKENNIVGKASENPETYDLMSAIMICLGSFENAVDNSLLKLLDVLLSNHTDADTKKKLLEEDFDIPMTEHLEGGMSEMCNLSEGVFNQGVEKGSKEATITAIGKTVVMLKKNNISRENALESLNEQYPDYSDVIISKIDEIYQ